MGVEIEVPIHQRKRVREVMRRGVAAVKANAKFYDQDTYGRVSALNPCESECCLLGFIDWLENGAKAHMWRVRFLDDVGISKAARAAMGLGPDDTVAPAYSHNNWPNPYKNQYGRATTGKERAAVLERRVEYWFETGL